MVKLTADLVLAAPQFTNPLKDREIDLRNQQISVIESLGVTQNQFDTIDLSSNDIRRLDGFPRLERLHTLFVNNNRISKIDPNLAQQLPNLKELMLSNNSLDGLATLEPLTHFKHLRSLSLLRNPVTRSDNYRLFLIHKIPSLKLLDFIKIKPKERQKAEELFAGEEGQQMLQDILGSRQQNGTTKASTEESSAPAKRVVDEQARKQAEAIREAIKKATSLEEIQRLEHQLKAGIVPEANKGSKADGDEEMDTED